MTTPGTNRELVEPHHGCPNCGERNVDCLVLDEDGGTVNCTNCGTIYNPLGEEGNPVKEWPANENLGRVLEELGKAGNALDSAIELARNEGVHPNLVWAMKKSMGRLAKIYDNLEYVQGCLGMTRPKP